MLVETTSRKRLSIKTQIVIIFDIIAWSFIIFIVGTGATDRGIIDWITNVVFWSLIIVSTLLLLEILLMSFFKEKLDEAPLVMWGLFFFFTAIDTLIVIITLIAMGLLTGNIG